ncbi:MAG TPA: hypothetical protein V6C65_25515 [Allocoleopsis sp.]
MIATHTAPCLVIVTIFAGDAETKAAIGSSLEAMLLQTPDSVQPSQNIDKRSSTLVPIQAFLYAEQCWCFSIQ